MEQWDAYDFKGHKLNKILIRGEKVPKGMYHLVSEIMVRHTDGSFLLMQRDHNKEVYPGHYEASAGGSVLINESAREGAIRELKEETGINSFISLEEVGVNIYDDSIFHSFICITDFLKDKITLQESETISYKWISEEEFKEYIHSDLRVPPQIDRFDAYIKTLFQ